MGFPQNAAQEGIKILTDEFRHHQNSPAIAAACMFSFDADASYAAFNNTLQVLDWAAEWGGSFLFQFKNELKRSRDEVFCLSLISQFVVALKSLILDFKTRSGPFEGLDAMVKHVRSVKKDDFDPLSVWACLTNPAAADLCDVAKALISVNPTEAAVERSFSAQDDVHSDERNRLSPEVIQAEMCLKWNCPLLARLPVFIADQEVELSDADDE